MSVSKKTTELSLEKISATTYENESLSALINQNLTKVIKLILIE